MGEVNVEQHIIADKTLIRTAQVTSWILTPFSIPFLAFLVLFLFSYLQAPFPPPFLYCRFGKYFEDSNTLLQD